MAKTKKEAEGSERYTDEFIFSVAMQRLATWPPEKRKAWLWAIGIVADVAKLASGPQPAAILAQSEDADAPLLNPADMQVWRADREDERADNGANQ